MPQNSVARLPLASQIPTNYDFDNLPHRRCRIQALDGLSYGLIDDNKLEKTLALITTYERGKIKPHAYLEKKKIKLSDFKGGRVCRYMGQECVFVPMLNYNKWHEIIGFEVIGERVFEFLTNEKGEKTNKVTLTFSKATGMGFNYMGNLESHLIGLAEGLATGVSGYYSGEFGAVIVSFTAMQLKRACEAFQSKKIVILADNDIKQYKDELKALVNTGRQVANECYYKYPHVDKVLFCEFQDTNLSDFNDLHVRFGLERLKKAIHYGLIEPELCRLISFYGSRIDVQVVHERYLSNLPEAKHLFSKSGLGTGKSTVQKPLIEVSASVLYATHRELLSQNIADRMGKLSFYKDKAFDSNFLSLCLPSFIKENLFEDNRYTGNNYDLVTTDEAGQCLGLLIGDLEFDKNATLQAMKGFYNLSGRNIWLDANLTFENVVSYMDMLPGEKFTFHLNTYPQYENRRATIYHSNDRQIRLKALFDKAMGYLLRGLKLCIACDSENQANDLFEKLQPVCPKMKLITGQERDSEFISNINENIKEYDCFIFNSVIGSGVSIDVSHFDKYLAAFNSFLSPSELWQILARPRPWDVYEIFMPSYADKDTDLLSLAQIKQGYIDLLVADELLHAKKKGLKITEAEMKRRRAYHAKENDEFLTIYARHEFERLLVRQHYLENFADLGISYGAEIELIGLETKAEIIAKRVDALRTDEVALAEILETKQGLIDKRVTRLMADDAKLTELGLEPNLETIRAHVTSEVLTMVAKSEYNKPLTEAKRLRADQLAERVIEVYESETERAKIADKLGVEASHVTVEEVQAELTNHLSNRLKWLGLHFKSADDLERMNEAEAGKVATDRRYYNIKQFLLNQALEVVGIAKPNRPLDFNATWQPENFDHEAINRLIRDNQISLHLIGLVSRAHVPNPKPTWQKNGAEENPKPLPDSTRFIHKILRKAGIKIKRVRSKVNGETVAHYEIGNKGFLEMWQRGHTVSMEAL